MEALKEAEAEIEQARNSISQTEVRTQLESISVSLEEMLDTAADERTDGDKAFADIDVAGAVPSDDNLRELDKNLGELAENTDREDVHEHIQNARRKIADYRTEQQDDG